MRSLCFVLYDTIMKKFLCLYLCLLVGIFPLFSYQICVAPMPREYDFINSYYIQFDKRTSFSAYDKALNPLAERWAHYYEECMGKKLWKTKFVRRHIEILIDPYMEDKHPQAYYIHAHDNWIEIHANTEVGAYYGLQTLSQLWEVKAPNGDLIWVNRPHEKDNPKLSVCARIADMPLSVAQSESLQKMYALKELIWRVPLMLIDDHPYCTHRGVEIAWDEWKKLSLKERSVFVERIGHFKYNTLVIELENEQDSLTFSNSLSSELPIEQAHHYVEVVGLLPSGRLIQGNQVGAFDVSKLKCKVFDSLDEAQRFDLKRDGVIYAFSYLQNIQQFATLVWCYPELRKCF